MLAEEEHEQKDGELSQLLEAQLKLDCQFQHGIRPVYAGSAANWLRVGYLLHAVAWRGSRLTANGLEHRLWLVFGGNDRVCAFIAARRDQVFTPCTSRTLSRVVARQLGSLAQV